ncbi:MAG: hypothetical protein ACOX8S_08480 [Christensenellales bacterium]
MTKPYSMPEIDHRIRYGWESLRGRPFVPARIIPGIEVFPNDTRPELAKDYTYSVANFAFRVFTLGEEEYYERANQVIVENAEYYADHLDVRDDRDSFYWSIGIFCRIVLGYGRNGSKKAGLLTPEAEKHFYRMIYSYCYTKAKMEDADWEKTQTWLVYESENHHLQRDSAVWMLCALLAEHEKYHDRPMADGYLPAEHFERRSEYFKHWIRQRAQKSLFIEAASNCYAAETMKNIYNIHDMTSDAELKRLTERLMDLFWANWAQEQLGGVRGGGQARIYEGQAIHGQDSVSSWAWYYFGIGEFEALKSDDYVILDSAYRPPELIGRLAVSPEERGVYCIMDRPLGMAADDNKYPFYHPRTDWGGICRYTYCTPDYNLGTMMSPELPNDDWLLISSQNRFQGARFASHRDAVIYLSPEIIYDRRSYNTFCSIISEGTLLTRQNHYADLKSTGYMGVWFSNAGGLSEIVEREGWIFTKTSGAYAAVHVVEGGYSLNEAVHELRGGKKISGLWARCKSRFTPVILETAQEKSYGSFEEFQRAVLALEKPRMKDGMLSYRSLYGHYFEFGMTPEQGSRIDGKDAIEPYAHSYFSPFVVGEWDSKDINVQFQGEELTLSF